MAYANDLVQNSNITTWSEYAREFKNCFVNMRQNYSIATRHEESKDLGVSWDVYLPTEVCNVVSCRSLDEARKLAALYGCGIIL